MFVAERNKNGGKESGYRSLFRNLSYKTKFCDSVVSFDDDFIRAKTLPAVSSDNRKPNLQPGFCQI